VNTTYIFPKNALRSEVPWGATLIELSNSKINTQTKCKNTAKNKTIQVRHMYARNFEHDRRGVRKRHQIDGLLEGKELLGHKIRC
jgi:hypothetical protein